MDSRNGNAAAAAAAPLPQHPHALLALPDLDRPPAVMEMWELEAVAAALPAKKRRLRETFDRLAACAPTPLPFRWEDLDTYITSLQYSVTLRRRQLRELDESRPAPAPAAVSAAGDDVRQIRALEKPRLVHASAPIPPAVSERAATGGDVHKPIRALQKSEPVHAAVLALAAVSAPAATGVDVGKGKKRKTSGQKAEAADHVPTRVKEAQAEMRKIHEDAAAKDAAASPLQDLNCKGRNLSPVPPGPGDDDEGHAAAEANATVQVVDPVSKIAVVQQELPVPVPAAAHHASNATNRGRLPLQGMSRPPRPIPAPAAVSAAPSTGSQEVEAANQKKDDLVVAKNTSHDGGEAEVSPCRPGHGSGNGLPITASPTQVGADPISKITGVGHEPPAATPHASNAASPPKVIASFPLAKVPKQEQQAVEEEVPDVEMEIVEAEEPKDEHPNDEVPDVQMEIVEPEEMLTLNDDAPVADEKASPLQVKAQEAGKVSPLPLACSDGLAQADACAATEMQADAAGATVRRSSPAATRDAPDLVPAGAPKSAGVSAATRDASDAARLAPAGARDDASKVSPVPPRRGNGLAPSGSGASTDDAMRTVAATRRGVNATDLVPATGREPAGPPLARAPPRASNKHVLQKQHMPPPMPRPGPGHPPPAGEMTVAELEAAVAALPGKRDALREAFDHLAACSPSPLPFAWEDLDAHLSSLHSSISLRFCQVRALEAERPAPAAAAPGETRGDGTGEEEVEEVADDGIGNVVKDANEAMLEEQDADEEMQGKVEEACGVKQEEEEERKAREEEEGSKNVTTEETTVVKEVSQDQGTRALPGGFGDPTAACANMDAQRIVKLLFTKIGLNLEFHAALHRAPDAAALALHVVELFLHDKMLKTNKAWVNCVGLIRMVPVVVTELSADTIEQAKPVAKNWKEMIDNSECCTVLGSLASWGFLYFLICYNIVSEFETKEIFHLFATMPRKQQKMNYAMLFKDLRLTDKIPVSLLKGYVEKAKQTAIEISQKNTTRESLSAVVKELDNLRRAQDLAEQQITDSSLSTSIREEINGLLRKFEKRKRSLAKSYTASTSNSQQQCTECNKKHKKEQEHHEGQESQQQGQQSKPGEKLEKKLDKPQQKQQHKQEDKLQEKQQHAKRPRQRTLKLPARVSPTAQNAPLRGHFGHPHHGYPVQPGWPGVHFVPPFSPQIGGPEYIIPFNPLYPHPEFYPWSLPRKVACCMLLEQSIGQESPVNKILVTDAFCKWFSKILQSEEYHCHSRCPVSLASWDKSEDYFQQIV
ncbi:hypothetical protein C2845_PM01G35980 [Panicum miliaceum]|uniref:FRIGIDA-like protein n=1 Tax=Panicum miliaceum TaxID=4540 RepID=A0A3L6TRL3_PANMI|nr:hypothetical protein C2845_PM01G35980 [Panicum miliaceum]